MKWGARSIPELECKLVQSIHVVADCTIIMTTKK